MTNIAHTQNCGSFKRFIAARQEGFIKYFTTTWISLCLLQQLIVLQYESCICVLSDISNNKCGSSGKSLRFRKFFTGNKPEILWYLDWEISLKSREYIAERHHEWTQRGCLGKGVRHACIQSDCHPCDVWWRGTSSGLYNNLKVSNYLSPPWGMLMLSSWRRPYLQFEEREYEGDKYWACNKKVITPERYSHKFTILLGFSTHQV